MQRADARKQAQEQPPATVTADCPLFGHLCDATIGDPCRVNCARLAAAAERATEMQQSGALCQVCHDGIGWNGRPCLACNGAGRFPVEPLRVIADRFLQSENRQHTDRSRMPVPVPVQLNPGRRKTDVPSSPIARQALRETLVETVSAGKHRPTF